MYLDKLKRSDLSGEPRRQLHPNRELSFDVLLDSGWLTKFKSFSWSPMNGCRLDSDWPLTRTIRGLGIKVVYSSAMY